MLNGPGKIFAPNGSVLEGEFRNGKLLTGAASKQSLMQRTSSSGGEQNHYYNQGQY